MIFARAIALVLATTLAAGVTSAQEAASPQLVDRQPFVAPQDKSALTDAPAAHKFFDHQQLLDLYAHSGMRLADTIKTCRELSHGGVERWIPTQSCGGIAAWQVGSVGLTLGVGWLLHKRGMHRLERIVPWVGTSAAAAGLTKSVFNIH
jgi:hypothetical protein